MNYINIDENNISKEHICCAIGNDKINKNRAEKKKEWLLERFKEGLVFRRLDDRGKVFIEYIPIEKTWKPVIGNNYIMINCLWVAGKFQKQGHANELLNYCINDAKKLGKSGLAVVTSTTKKGFLTDKSFFVKNGFITCDTAQPYFELMILQFDNKTDKPKFSDYAKKGICENKNGFTIMFSNQCPFTEEYVNVMADVLKSKNIEYQIIKIESCEDAKKYTSPFGTYNIFYKGKIVNHEIMPYKKFEKFVDSIVE